VPAGTEPGHPSDNGKSGSSSGGYSAAATGRLRIDKRSCLGAAHRLGKADSAPTTTIHQVVKPPRQAIHIKERSANGSLSQPAALPAGPSGHSRQHL